MKYPELPSAAAAAALPCHNFVGVSAYPEHGVAKLGPANFS
jgi:hypothetical protein